MKRWVNVPFLFVLCAVSALSCSAFQSRIPKDVNLPPADPQLLYKYISRENSYVNWDLWPGKGKMYEGKPPHGAFLTTYVNNTALASMKAKRKMADGAIVVKENYTAVKELAAVTVMYKIEGYHKAAGDWFWAKYGADGSVQKAGKVDGCINCHGAKKENDYFFSGDFVKRGGGY